MAIQIPQLTEKQKKWARRVGYPLFGLLAFVYAIHLTFPYERIEQRLQAVAGEHFDVSLAAAGPGWFPGDVELEGLTFKSRPTRPDEKPLEFTIDELSLDLGLFAAMTGTVDVELEAVVGEGTIEGQITASKSEVSIQMESEQLPLASLPGIRSATGGAPMSGGASLNIDVTLPKNSWKEAGGKITLACASCTIGDGQSKVRANQPGGASNAFSEGGFTLPRLNLGQIGGTLDIVKGVGTFKDFAGKSPDGEITIEGKIAFEDPVGRSQVTAYMKFKATDALIARESKMGDIVAMMKGQAQRPDGFMGVKVIGQLSALRFIGSKVSPVSKDEGGGSGPGSNRASRAAAGMVGANADTMPRPAVADPPFNPPDSAPPPMDQMPPSIPPPTPPPTMEPPTVPPTVPPPREDLSGGPSTGLVPTDGSLRETMPPNSGTAEEMRPAEPAPAPEQPPQPEQPVQEQPVEAQPVQPRQDY